MGISSETTFDLSKVKRFYWAFKSNRLKPPAKADGTRMPMGFMYPYQNKSSASNNCGVLLAMQIDVLNVAYDKLVAGDYRGAQDVLDGKDPQVREEYSWFFGDSVFANRDRTRGRV